MKKVPALISLGVVGVAIAAVCYIPLPHHIDAAFEIRPSKPGRIYANTPGQVEFAVKPGTDVKQGDVIAQLKNPDLEMQLVSYQGEEEVAKIRLRNLALRSRSDRSLKAQLETQTEMLESIQALKKKTEEKIGQLAVIASRDGIVLPPPLRKPQQNEQDNQLPGWSGSPLEERNRGAHLTADDLICEIGTADEFEAILVIDQGDVQLVREGQEVDLKLDSRRMETFHGKIVEKSQQPLDVTSTSLSSQTGGDLQTEIDPTTGMVKPRNVTYQARGPIETMDLPLRPGYRGSAKVHVDPMSLGSRLWRFAQKTFNFEL